MLAKLETQAREHMRGNEMTEFECMTEKQEAFLNSLLSTRETPALITETLAFLQIAGGKLDKATASQYITQLLGSPLRAVTVAVPPTHLSHSDAPVAPVKSMYTRFKELPVGFYTVAGGQGAYGDSTTAVYIVVDKKQKYGPTKRYVRRLFRQYDGKPKWLNISYSAAVNILEGRDTVPVAEIAKLGLAFGFCLNCLRLLTDPFSVANGIGPVCAARLGYNPAAKLAV